MKPKFGHLLLLSYLFVVPALAADEEPVLTDAVVTDIGQTYGFYLGQSFSLNAIEHKFPDIAPQARIAKLQFDASFGSSIANMDAVLTRTGGEWSKVKMEWRDNIAANLGSQTFTRDSAKEFTAAVGKCLALK